MIVKLSLDNQRFIGKPSKSATAVVSKRIGKCVTNIQISEFARSIVQPHGRTFSPAIFKNGNRSNKTWISQQVFALDIDNGITVVEVLNKCRFLNLAPNFIYTTFSHTESNPKFRVVFVIDEVIEDIRVRNLIQKSLMRIFPQVDPSTGDPSRIFFGGKEVVYEDFSSIASLLDIYHAACTAIRGGSNPSRDMERFCMSTGVDMINGNPKVQIFSSQDEMLKVDTDDNIFTSMTKKWSHPNTNNREGPDFSHMYYAIYFNRNNTTNFNRNKNESFYLTFEVEKHRVKRSLVRRYNFDDLYKYCKLYRESLDGRYWLYHDEMFGVMTNLLQIKGGSTKLDAILNSRSEYQDKISSWKIMKNQIIKANYSPMRCDNYCPFMGECIHNINMIEQGKLIFGRVQVRNEVKTKTLLEARNELKMVVRDIIGSSEKGIYVIKAPAGLGKTEEYINACKDHNLTIAVPTHRLKEGVSGRLIDKGIEHFSIPELPHMENSKRQRLERLYNTGAFRGAKAYLNKLAVENVEIKEYLDELDNARDIRNRTILTTHKRVLHDKDHNDTIVIDEDIILNALFEINTVSIWDVTLIKERLIAEPSIAKLSRSKRIIDEILSILINSPEGLVQKTPNFFMPYANEIEKIIALDDRITTNVILFLSSSHFIKIRGEDGEIQIRFINRMQLPNKKIIILSATIDEVIAKMVFGEQIYFHDIGEVEQKGELIQIANKSFTKSTINKNPTEMYNLAKNLMESHNPNSKVITFKGYFNDISEKGINFWNNAGIDELKGRNLTIVGTPHVDPYFYLLFANALGHDVQFDGSKINYLPASDGNYKFYFYTYGSDDFLRAIQFYIVKTELMQAVGRARTITEPCRVLILSNFPVPGAEFISYTKKEIMDLKVS